MIDLLKKWSGVAGSVIAVITLLGIVSAWGDGYIDRRIQLKIAGMAGKSDVDGLSRRFNGMQEQLNSSASDNRVIREKLEGIEKRQLERSKAMEKQLELIIKLIEKKQ